MSRRRTWNRKRALFVTPTGFVTTSFRGETALSLTQKMAAAIATPQSPSAADLRASVRAVLAIDDSPAGVPPSRILSRIRKPGYRAEQFELTSDREIRIPGWLLTPDTAGAVDAHGALPRRAGRVELSRRRRVCGAVVRQRRMSGGRD